MPPKQVNKSYGKRPVIRRVGDAVFLVLAMNQDRTEHEVIGPRKVTVVDLERRRVKLDDNPYCWVKFTHLARNYYTAMNLAKHLSSEGVSNQQVKPSDATTVALQTRG